MVTDEGSKEKVDVSPTAGTTSTVQTGSVSEAKEKVVPESQYIGVKEMLRKREGEMLTQQTTYETKITTLQTELEEKKTQMEGLIEKAKNLEEQTKTKVNKEEHDKVLKTLESKVGEVLEAKKDVICVKYGLAKETLKDLSEQDLASFEKGLALAKTKSAVRPDIGGSGGLGVRLEGSPMELARQHYEQSSKK